MDFFIKEIFPWLTNISIFSPLLPFAACLLLWAGRKSIHFKLLFLYCLLAISGEAVGWLMIYLGTSNNLWVIHVYSTFEFWILAAIYYHSFRRPWFRWSAVAAIVVFTLISIGNALYGEGITLLNSVPKMVENTFLIGFIVLYFYKVANDLKITYLDEDGIFLFSCALLIYKAGTTMADAMFNAALAESYNAAYICVAIRLVLNVFFYTSLIFVVRRVALNEIT